MARREGEADKDATGLEVVRGRMDGNESDHQGQAACIGNRSPAW